MRINFVKKLPMYCFPKAANVELDGADNHILFQNNTNMG